MILLVIAGSTSQPIPVFIQTTGGGGYSGLVYNTSQLVCEYRRKGQSSFTSVSLVTATLGTWTSGGFIANGSLAGRYELGLPNAAIASGVDWVEVWLYGAASMQPAGLFIQLTQGSGSFKANTAAGFEFAMVQSSDHATAYTGGSVTATREIVGSGTTTASGSVTQIGSTNRYYFSGAAADFNGANVTFTFTASGADPVTFSINTTP